MGDAAKLGEQTSSRLSELDGHIERAASILGELREKNHALRAEVAELRSRLESAEEEASAGDGAASDDELRDEVERLREERETIRAKVKQLLERVEKLEAS